MEVYWSCSQHWKINSIMSFRESVPCTADNPQNIVWTVSTAKYFYLRSATDRKSSASIVFGVEAEISISVPGQIKPDPSAWLGTARGDERMWVYLFFTFWKVNCPTAFGFAVGFDYFAASNTSGQLCYKYMYFLWTDKHFFFNVVVQLLLILQSSFIYP